MLASSLRAKRSQYKKLWKSGGPPCPPKFTYYLLTLIMSAKGRLFISRPFCKVHLILFLLAVVRAGLDIFDGPHDFDEDIHTVFRLEEADTGRGIFAINHDVL